MKRIINTSELDINKEDEINIATIVITVITILQRRIKFFVFIIALGAMSGVVRYFTTKPAYEIAMMGSSKVLTNVRLQNLIGILHKLAQERNSIQLAEKLHISPQLSATIKSIEVKDIDDLVKNNSLNQISKVDSNVFEITLVTYHYQAIDSLQAGILYYLQHNDFVQRRITIKKQNLEILLRKVQEEQKKLDTLRFSVNKMLSKGTGGNSTVLMSDPGSVNKDIMALYEKELQIKSDLLFIDDIQVIQGFTPFSTPTSPKLVPTVAASTATSIVIALILIAILEARRGMRKLKSTMKARAEEAV